MNRLLNNYPEWPYGYNIGPLMLRLVFAGTLLFAHGIDKWEMIISTDEVPFFDPIGLGSDVSLGLAAFAEIICAVLVVLGIMTRWALIPLIINFIVILFTTHHVQSLTEVELPLFYLAGFIILLFIGPGTISIDAVLSKE